MIPATAAVATASAAGRQRAARRGAAAGAAAARHQVAARDQHARPGRRCGRSYGRCPSSPDADGADRPRRRGRPAAAALLLVADLTDWPGGDRWCGARCWPRSRGRQTRGAGAVLEPGLWTAPLTAGAPADPVASGAATAPAHALTRSSRLDGLPPVLVDGGAGRPGERARRPPWRPGPAPGVERATPPTRCACATQRSRPVISGWRTRRSARGCRSGTGDCRRWTSAWPARPPR